MKLQIHRDLYIPDYDGEILKCNSFITEFQDSTISRANEDPLHGKLKYMIMLQKIANRELISLEIELGDLEEFFDSARDHGFVERVRMNTSRYVALFSQIVDKNLPQPSIDIQGDGIQSSYDIQMAQRRFNAVNANQAMIAQGLLKPDQTQNGRPQKLGIPPELERTYHLSITPGENSKKNVVQMRQIKSNAVGSLVVVKGIVTRCSDVKPCIQVADYACDACGFEVYQVIQQKQFTPLLECPSMKCVKNQVKGQLVLQVKASKFISYQDIKIQEPSDQVPIGHVPRTMKVIARGPVTRQCSPGDIVQVTGIYMPSPQHGFNRNRSMLLHDTHIEAYKIVKDKQNYKEYMLSDEMMDRVNEIKSQSENENHLFRRLSSSICPEIFGMEEIKQALLLLMIGGVNKDLKDGMKIRGHLNALLMGDPGVAKSQLLKHISGFAPRGIYTTGKGSSGVGLTAAVMKDPNTGEVVLEGGALVLADTGICCIDEFDKMDERDRTNIHEVMEQQTISIAKAGITTSLNARTSILAAANPVYGRYNKKLQPHENINLPAALLSRFDLIFLLLDLADSELDTRLAQHVTNVHRSLSAPASEQSRIPQETMRSFIAHAQTFSPIIPPELHNYIVAKYVEKRKFQREGNDAVSYMYITPRTLLGIIRICQSMAKLHFRDRVEQQDVDQALRLMDYSIRSLRNIKEDEGGKRKGEQQDQYQEIMSRVINDVRSMMQKSDSPQMNVVDIMKKLTKMNPGQYSSSNFKMDNLLDVLTHYKKLNVIYLDQEDNVIFL